MRQTEWLQRIIGETIKTGLRGKRERVTRVKVETYLRMQASKLTRRDWAN